MCLHQYLTTRGKLPGKAPTRVALAIVLTCAGAAISTAQTAPDADGDDGKGRFSLAPVDGGVLRLDRETGAMTLCTKAKGKLACEPVASPKPGKVGTNDNAKAGPGNDPDLRAQNRELRDRIRSLEEMIETMPGIDGGPPPPAPVEPSVTVPSEEDVDRALDYVESILKKFRERIRRFDDPLPPEDKKPPADEPSPPL